MNKKSILISGVICLFCFVLIKVLVAVPYNGRLSISPTGTHCVNEISVVNGYWMTTSGDWVAQTAILSYQNIKDAADNNSVTVGGSSGTTSIAIGSKAGHYDLSITVTYTCGSKSVTVHEVGELCIVDVFSVSGGGETICKGSSLDFHAEEAPTTCQFPSGQPEWEMGKKGVSSQFENWERKGTGADISVTFNQVGVFKLRARCGASSSWVESLEVKVPSDGTITTDPKIICADYSGNITLKATLDDTSAFHDDFDSYPIWQKNDNPLNPNQWDSLPQLTGKLTYSIPFSTSDGSTGEMKIRAKFCDSYDWKESVIKIVDIEKVSVDKSLVCINEPVNVKAISTSGDLLQESEVRWMMNYKEKFTDTFNDADWKATNFNGMQIFSHAFSKTGAYKFRVKCCELGNWIESNQVCVYENKILNSVTTVTLIENLIEPDNINDYGHTYVDTAEVKAEFKVYLDCDSKNWKVTISKFTSSYKIFYRIFSYQIEASATNASAQNCHRMIQNLKAFGKEGPGETVKYYSTEAVKQHELGHAEDWKSELNEELDLFIEKLSQLSIPVNCGDTEEYIVKKFSKDYDLDAEVLKMAKRAESDWYVIGHTGNSVLWEKKIVDKIVSEIIALNFPGCN